MQIMNTNQPPTGNNGAFTKRWVLAKRKYGHTQNQLNNETVESAFHSMLYKVKQLLKQHQSNQTVFEKDFRFDNTQDAFCLHAFISSNVYLYLECSLDYVYRIEYAFNNCRHEAAIRELLDAYVFIGRTKEVELQPDFSTFYAGVLRIQEKKHITVL